MNGDISLANTRKLVNEYIQDVLKNRIAEASNVDQTYETFWRHINDVVVAGGKRIRPYLVMLGNGAIDVRVLPIAVAQELLHIAMLMHDDVIDKDFVRHGKKNISGIYRDTYGAYLNDETLATHYGHGAGVLAGDVLISEAYYLVASSDFDDETKRKITHQLQRSIFEVVGGELMDVEAGFMESGAFDLLQVYRYKTASYSFIGPLVSGAYCANLDETMIDAFEAYATHVGIAFQIQDDLLGVYGDQEETGKSRLTDLHEGKRTVLTANHERAMNQQQRQRFDAVFGSSTASDIEIQVLLDDMEASGAKELTRKQAEHYFALARGALDSLPEGVQKAGLVEFTSSLQNRRK